jgi:hypothetical protein
METEEEEIDHSLYPPLDGNELFEKWKSNQTKLPSDFNHLFDPEIEEQHRGDLFEAEDDGAMEKYAWAIPDDRALRICAHFGKRFVVCYYNVCAYISEVLSAWMMDCTSILLS